MNENNNIYFDPELIRKGKELFYICEVQKISDNGIYFEPSNTNSGCRVIIFFSSWEYETETVMHSNEELEKLIQDELSDRAYFWQHG